MNAETIGKSETIEPSMGQLMMSDIRAWAKLWSKDFSPDSPISPKIAARLVFNYCGLRASLLYRLSHGLWKKRVPVLPGMVSRMNIMLYGFDVPSNIEIGAGLYMPHPVGIVINANRIGANVTLISSITIGMGRTVDFPTIEDDVFVGAGARVLGGIRIGKGAKIGANAVVLHDVPPGATVVGIPAKIVQKNKDEKD